MVSLFEHDNIIIANDQLIESSQESASSLIIPCWGSPFSPGVDVNRPTLSLNRRMDRRTNWSIVSLIESQQQELQVSFILEWYEREMMKLKIYCTDTH